MRLWGELPIGRVVSLVGAAPAALALTLVPLAAEAPAVPVDARAAPSMPTVRPDRSAASVVSSDTTTTDVPAGSTVRMTGAAAAGAATRPCPACALRAKGWREFSASAV